MIYEFFKYGLNLCVEGVELVKDLGDIGFYWCIVNVACVKVKRVRDSKLSYNVILERCHQNQCWLALVL